jgi:glutamate-ammonia-ligase adenylyltransferase
MEEEKSKTALENDLNSSLRILKTREKKIETLCIFKRKELLRIGVRDLLKKTSVQKTTAALSMLAETILQKIYEICDEKMQTQFGEPRFLRKKPNKRKRGFTILGMGKLGGGELNFSSDIDLIYMYESEEGWTSGQTSKGEKSKISHHEYFRKLSQEITSILTGVTNEGTLYRVDLRLRPEGRSGPVANSLKAYLTYYENRGSTWERLALLKARPVAGDSILGLQFLKKVSPFIFQKSFSLTHLQEVKTLKDKIDHTIKKRGETQTNVKLGTGGIREIEFMVQTLQIFFGSNFKKICHRNTQTSLKKLLREKFISKETYNDLNHAYIFLRNAEHRLQMVHESQTHNLPQDLTELRICALRLDYRDQKGISASDQFLRNYKTHTERVHRLFRKLFDPPHVSLKGPSKGNPLL